MPRLKLDAQRNGTVALPARMDVSTLAQHDVQALVDQLQLQRVELELQNEELRKVQRALQESQQHYKELFERAPVGYVTLGVDGAIASTNDIAVSMLRRDRDGLSGTPFAELVADHHRARLDQHLREACAGEHASCQLQLQIESHDARRFELHTRYIAGGWPHHLMMISDVTAPTPTPSLAVEARAPQSPLPRDTLGATAGTDLNRATPSAMSQRGAERVESLETMAAGIAHDFNNLLVGVLSNADLVLSSPDLPEALREPLSLIERAGHDAAVLTQQLLVFAGEHWMRKSAIDLRDVAREWYAQLVPRIAGGVRVELSVASELPTVEADRGQLQQAVCNLLTNACEAVGQHGAVAIRCYATQLDERALSQFTYHHGASPGEFVIVEVEDSGPGISAENLPRIFDPFFTTKFTGRGLGLAAVLGVVQGHRGAVRAQSQLGCGAKFELALPITQRASASCRAPMASQPSARARGNVLLVDDDRAVRKVVAMQIEALGLTVETLASGAEALDALRNAVDSFDLMILDWLMPEVSGEQVLTVVRQLAPSVPVVIISGYCSASLGIEDPFVMCLQKPFTLSELEAAVQLSLQPWMSVSHARRGTWTG